MCGRERTCGRVFLYVWQGKGLREAENGILAPFSDVWQGKELNNREVAIGE
jgi:hypothetical protein